MPALAYATQRVSVIKETNNKMYLYVFYVPINHFLFYPLSLLFLFCFEKRENNNLAKSSFRLVLLAMFDCIKTNLQL